MPSIELLIPFATSECDFCCVNDDTDVAPVSTRLVRRLVLALQNHCQLCSQMADNLQTLAGRHAIVCGVCHLVLGIDESDTDAAEIDAAQRLGDVRVRCSDRNHLA